MVVVNRYINIGREVDGKQETIDLVPGEEAPAWAAKLIKPEHLGDPRDPLEEQDQFLTALRETATREGIEWTPEWRKEDLTQAITAVRQAASTGVVLDRSQFGPPGVQVPTQTDESGSGEQLKALDKMSRDELEAEYVDRFKEKPHHALADKGLRERLQEARDKG